jgi:Ca-activated chloride channel family protein
VTKDISLQAHSDRDQVACEVTSQCMIEWMVTAQRGKPVERAPLNIALVLDRSGSMRGEKLAFVKQAASYVIDMLDQRDRIAAVAYDDRVTVLAPSEQSTAHARQHLKDTINALTPGGWTDLAGGWLEGCREIAAHSEQQGVNRALLLTDGLANRGITDIEELTHHARQLRQRGIATSTFGVGLDFNEHLLEGLATEGGGHFYFIERPDQIPQMFQRELGELLTVIAREAVLTLPIVPGVGIELLGDIPHERDGERLRIYLGDLFAGEERRLYTRVLTPPDALGTVLTIRGILGYADIDGRAQEETVVVRLTYQREAEVRLLPVNTQILQRAGEVELAAAASKAIKLEREGLRSQAQSLMAQTLAATQGVVAAPAAALYGKLATDLNSGLTETRRKQEQFQAYQKRHSRKE